MICRCSGIGLDYILPEKPPIQISYTTPEEIGFAWEEDGLELEVAEVLPVEEISLAPDPDADASAPEAPADSDGTNGTEAAAASDAPAQTPHTEAPAAAQPAAPAVPVVKCPASARILFSISSAISGWSRRNNLAFSRPWPSFSPL